MGRNLALVVASPVLWILHGICPGLGNWSCGKLCPLSGDGFCFGGKDRLMKKLSIFAYIIPLFADQAVAAPAVDSSALIIKTESLLKLSEQNIAWAQHLLQLNTGFISVIALSFVSIVIYIIKQMKDIHREQRINEEKIKQINELASQMVRINSEISQVKSDMRDATLANRAKTTTDDDIAKFIRDALRREPNIDWVNFLKNLMWKENVGLEQLRPAAEDADLQQKIKKAYNDEFPTDFLNDRRAVEWAYKIKVKGLLLTALLLKEHSEKEATNSLYRSFLGQLPKWRDKGGKQ